MLKLAVGRKHEALQLRAFFYLSFVSHFHFYDCSGDAACPHPSVGEIVFNTTVSLSHLHLYCQEGEFSIAATAATAPWFACYSLVYLTDAPHELNKAMDFMNGWGGKRN